MQCVQRWCEYFNLINKSNIEHHIIVKRDIDDFSLIYDATVNHDTDGDFLVICDTTVKHDTNDDFPLIHH